MPGPHSWDLWSGLPGAPFARSQSVPLAEGGSPASFRHAQVFGIPVTAVYAVPLWVPSTDPEIVSSAVELQLEKLNLRAEEGPGNLLERQTVEVTPENHTLLLVTVVNERNLGVYPRETPDRFEITPALYYLPDNAVVVWQELGKLVVTVTRGDRPVYFQAMTSSVLDLQAVHDIQLLVMQLEMQGIVTELESVVLWTDAVESGADTALAEALGVGLTHAPLPKPAPPQEVSSVLPHSIELRRAAVARARRVKLVSMACAAAYLALAGWYSWFCIKEKWATEALKLELDQLRGQYAWIEPERERWHHLLEVTNGDRYPVERFFQVTKTLDEDAKVRLTKFIYEPNKLIIQGEAQDVTKAITYVNGLSRSPELSDYIWDKTSPQGQKNNTATFTATGTYKNASPESK